MTRRRLALFLLVLASTIACGPTPPPAERAAAGSKGDAPALSVDPGRTPEQVVEELGARLDEVSILAPPQEVAKAMRDSWGTLVDPTLLERWIASPADSPGRATSSPRPDRIEVRRTERSTGDRAIVTGVLVEATSTGDASRKPVRLELERREGRWLVTSFAREDPPSSGASDDALAAVRAVEDFYAAVDHGDLRRAWNLWGPSGAPGRTFEGFAAGYASTERVRVETGAPSRVEAAAGSRYVEVPVVITARQTGGSVRRFEGTYTVRRSVVDGATAGQRQWHLYRADVKPVD